MFAPAECAHFGPSGAMKQAGSRAAADDGTTLGAIPLAPRRQISTDGFSGAVLSPHIVILSRTARLGDPGSKKIWDAPQRHIFFHRHLRQYGLWKTLWNQRSGPRVVISYLSKNPQKCTMIAGSLRVLEWTN